MSRLTRVRKNELDSNRIKLSVQSLYFDPPPREEREKQTVSKPFRRATSEPNNTKMFTTADSSCVQGNHSMNAAADMQLTRKQYFPTSAGWGALINGRRLLATVGAPVLHPCLRYCQWSSNLCFSLMMLWHCPARLRPVRATALQARLRACLASPRS